MKKKQVRLTLSEDAFNLLEMLEEIFHARPSRIVEEMIIDGADAYANKRKEILEAWMEKQEAFEDDDVDDDEGDDDVDDDEDFP